MNRQIVAVFLQEGSKFITELIKNRSPKRAVAIEKRSALVAVAVDEPQEEIAEGNKASSIEAGCVPCAIGHLGTCTGVLNEAMRFAKKDGASSIDVIDRVNICLDELNALERVDLRSELIVNLSPWEKDLANDALIASRNMRHDLEAFSGTSDLERVTAKAQRTRQEIGRVWFQQRLANMSPEEKRKIAEKAIEKMEEVSK